MHYACKRNNTEQRLEGEERPDRPKQNKEEPQNQQKKKKKGSGANPGHRTSQNSHFLLKFVWRSVGSSKTCFLIHQEGKARPVDNSASLGRMRWSKLGAPSAIAQRAGCAHQELSEVLGFGN